MYKTIRNHQGQIQTNKPVWQSELHELIPASELRRQIREIYGCGVSSRYTPLRLPGYPDGAWMIEDEHVFLYGHEIEELRSFDPAQLVVSEHMVECNEEGRGDDARRYAEWWRQGIEPPPISVVETLLGKWSVTDGHRRVAAALIVGKPIRGWFSPYIFVGEEGRVVQAGLTFEIAVIEAYRRGELGDGARVKQILESALTCGGAWGLTERYPQLFSEIGINAQHYLAPHRVSA